MLISDLKKLFGKKNVPKKVKPKKKHFFWGLILKQFFRIIFFMVHISE
jgi:hypothetical protein